MTRGFRVSSFKFLALALLSFALPALAQQPVQGNVASGATDSGKPVKTGCVYNATLPSPSSTQRVNSQCDRAGRAIVVQQPDAQTTSYHASKKFAASSTTDNAVLPGNATNTVVVNRITLTCTQTTAGVINVEVLKRSAADTSGTSAAMTVVPGDSSYAAGVSAPLSYTGTGPTVGTPVGDLDNGQVGCIAPATATANDIYVYRPLNPIVLRGTAEQIAVNVGNAALTGGNITVTFDYTETTTP